MGSTQSQPDSITVSGNPTPIAPKHPRFSNKVDREASFRHWSPAMSIKPKDLAEAGFFYLGRDDSVECYHCGVALRKWNPEERPWEEHAKWRPDCAFLQLMKGQEFVDQVEHRRWLSSIARESRRHRNLRRETTPEDVTVFLVLPGSSRSRLPTDE